MIGKLDRSENADAYAIVWREVDSKRDSHVFFSQRRNMHRTQFSTQNVLNLLAYLKAIRHSKFLSQGQEDKGSSLAP